MYIFIHIYESGILIFLVASILRFFSWNFYNIVVKHCHKRLWCTMFGDPLCIPVPESDTTNYPEDLHTAGCCNYDRTSKISQKIIQYIFYTWNINYMELFEGFGDPYIHQNTKFINKYCYTQIPTLVIKVLTKYSLLS